MEKTAPGFRDLAVETTWMLASPVVLPAVFHVTPKHLDMLLGYLAWSKRKLDAWVDGIVSDLVACIAMISAVARFLTKGSLREIESFAIAGWSFKYGCSYQSDQVPVVPMAHLFESTHVS